ncbi:MAG: hypothetical protein JW769_03950 [Parachlamydiales bacterium]|nr:hypothetical protein [Parachlamydiales bacterium]
MTIVRADRADQDSLWERISATVHQAYNRVSTIDSADVLVALELGRQKVVRAAQTTLQYARQCRDDPRRIVRDLNGVLPENIRDVVQTLSLKTQGIAARFLPLSEERKQEILTKSNIHKCTLIVTHNAKVICEQMQPGIIRYLQSEKFLRENFTSIITGLQMYLSPGLLMAFAAKSPSQALMCVSASNAIWLDVFHIASLPQFVTALSVLAFTGRFVASPIYDNYRNWQEGYKIARMQDMRRDGVDDLYDLLPEGLMEHEDIRSLFSTFKHEQLMKEPFNDGKDPINMQYALMPVLLRTKTAVDGIIYHLPTIVAWLENNPTSPLTRISVFMEPKAENPEEKMNEILQNLIFLEDLRRDLIKTIRTIAGL